MANGEVDKRILEAVKQLKGKRARIVAEHIIEHGQVTTEDLANYGYNHPPRAARDVREAGIPLVTVRVQSTDGRSIGAYRFGDPKKIRRNMLGGRSVLSKEMANSLYEEHDGRCSICYNPFQRRYLQMDHRVPYEVAGEMNDAEDSSAFMPLCGTCQRKKSWSCENCPNWEDLAPEVCQTCYWARPEEYEHIATLPIRRLDLSFSGGDAVIVDRLLEYCKQAGKDPREWSKEALLSVVRRQL